MYDPYPLKKKKKNYRERKEKGKSASKLFAKSCLLLIVKLYKS
jgi:hypothetical protein